jgi:hypothetical protein
MTVAALGGGGAIRVSQITLNETQLPWTGIYFRGVPVTVTALPRETHRFVGWQGRAETNATLEVDLAGDLALTAVFAPQWGYQDPSWRPKPFDLWGRAYSLASFSAATPAGVYPPNMLFLQSSVRDPGLEVETDSEWQLPYNLSSKSRVRALGDLGFSFLNTSEPQAEPGAGFLGAAVLSLRTLSVQHVRVTWTGGTVNPNSRGYAIRLQYRVGSQGSFQDVPDAAGKPVEYVRSEVIGDLQVLGPVELPAAADNQPLVQLRWKYYALPGSASGARAELRVDDIFVTGQSLGPLLGGINALGQGVLRAQFLGVPARALTVESSQDLKEWLPWRAREFDADGWFMLEEPALGGGAARFFRLRVP